MVENELEMKLLKPKNHPCNKQYYCRMVTQKRKNS